MREVECVVQVYVVYALDKKCVHSTAAQDLIHHFYLGDFVHFLRGKLHFITS